MTKQEEEYNTKRYYREKEKQKIECTLEKIQHPKANIAYVSKSECTTKMSIVIKTLLVNQSIMIDSMPKSLTDLITFIKCSSHESYARDRDRP